MSSIETLRERFASLSPHLDERGRRLLAATEAKALGRGGIKIVSGLTGVAASRIGRGLKQLASGEVLEPGRLRRPGAGRKALVDTDRGLVDVAIRCRRCGGPARACGV